MTSHFPLAGRAPPVLAVVVPCFRVRDQVAGVLRRIGPEVSQVIVVDDACPEGSGRHVEDTVSDPRLRVLFNERNEGVGGALKAGYRAALDAGADVIVKLDGDGQMDPALIPAIARPVLEGRADYAKGNRFHSIWNVRQMPRLRLFGNACLSFMTKMSSGYWSVFDPTNGYTAVHAAALRQLEFANIADRYFFESDMLINLGNVRAVVADVPMRALYADEVSNLKVRHVLGQFLRNNLRELGKRILYTYFLRDFSLASAQLLFGTFLMIFGLIFGGIHWHDSVATGRTASTGTVMLAVLPIFLGFQLILTFLGFDMANEPRIPIQPSQPWRDWPAPPPLLVENGTWSEPPS